MQPTSQHARLLIACMAHFSSTTQVETFCTARTAPHTGEDMAGASSTHQAAGSFGSFGTSGTSVLGTSPAKIPHSSSHGSGNGGGSKRPGHSRSGSLSRAGAAAGAGNSTMAADRKGGHVQGEASGLPPRPFKRTGSLSHRPAQQQQQAAGNNEPDFSRASLGEWASQPSFGDHRHRAGNSYGPSSAAAGQQAGGGAWGGVSGWQLKLLQRVSSRGRAYAPRTVFVDPSQHMRNERIFITWLTWVWRVMWCGMV